MFVDGGCSVVKLEFDDSAEEGRQVRPGLSLVLFLELFPSGVGIVFHQDDDSAVPSALVIIGH